MKNWTTLVTICALIAYFGVSLRVGLARKKFSVAAPAVTGDPNFERIFRAQQNMLEWLPIFLPLLWIFAFYVSDAWAAILGLLWIVARILYALEAERRAMGFVAQLSVCAILAIGDLIGALRQLL